MGAILSTGRGEEVVDPDSAHHPRKGVPRTKALGWEARSSTLPHQPQAKDLGVSHARLYTIKSKTHTRATGTEVSSRAIKSPRGPTGKVARKARSSTQPTINHHPVYPRAATPPS